MIHMQRFGDFLAIGTPERVHNGAEVSGPFPLRGFLKLPIVGFKPFCAEKMTVGKGFHGSSSFALPDKRCRLKCGAVTCPESAAPACSSNLFGMSEGGRPAGVRSWGDIARERIAKANWPEHVSAPFLHSWGVFWGAGGPARLGHVYVEIGFREVDAYFWRRSAARPFWGVGVRFSLSGAFWGAGVRS